MIPQSILIFALGALWFWRQLMLIGAEHDADADTGEGQPTFGVRAGRDLPALSCTTSLNWRPTPRAAPFPHKNRGEAVGGMDRAGTRGGSR